MKTGDKVQPAEFKKDTTERPGIVKMVCGQKAVVTWYMGSSGWPWTVTHNLHELREVEPA